MPGRTKTAQRGHIFPMVRCPVCHKDVILDLDYWHTDCKPCECADAKCEEYLLTINIYADNYVASDMPYPFPIPEQHSGEMTEQEYDDLYPMWTPAKNGGFYTEQDGAVLVVKQTRDKKWSCGGYESGEDGPSILTWKRGFKTEKAAQDNILKRLEMRNR